MEEIRPRRRSSIILLILGLVLMTAGILLLSGVFYERAYAGRMYPGVTVLGEVVSGKTYSEVQVVVAQRANQFLDTQLELRYEDGGVEIITPRQLGVELDADSLTLAAYERGRSGNFWDRLSHVLLLQLGSSAVAATAVPTFDTDKILASLESSFVKHEKPSVNATLLEEAGVLKISIEKAGVNIDRALMSDLLETALTDLTMPPVIDVPILVIQPTVTAADLTPLLSQAQRLTQVPLLLLTGEQEFSITSTRLASWIVADTTVVPPTLSWGGDQIRTYLGTIARKIDKPMQPKKINIQDGGVLEEGVIGSQLDREAAIKSILASLTARTEQSSLTPISTAPVVLTINELPIEEQTITPPFTPGLYAGKYIEVNLTEQILYQWEGSNMIASYPISSGKWSTPSPEGVLYVKNHISYAYSRKFDLYMPWWLGLAWNPDGSGFEGYGIHELPEWRGGKKEGEAHLGTPVSHGCVRLGVGPAEAVYNWAEEGMPVYIHK